ncbi:Protein-serine/threonine phosphatase [Heracleum sosnowskyi]|uniref:protein-serine/threonine phosphatase n=1 Tax=Heracleum sosnowskyi TaxID=360622 RepID=A0AAD8H933_9APIA|nr:Protein-serine/threonine phosphatase [Heracleum sosnowskyi]
MATSAQTDFSHPFRVLQSSVDKEEVSISTDEISENSADLNQIPNVRPPRHLSIGRHCINSLTETGGVDLESDCRILRIKSPSDGNLNLLPVFRSGSCADKGAKQCMEDVHICIDDLVEELGAGADASASFLFSGAFYGVFDGHGGIDAASFVRKNILEFIIDDSQFPVCLQKAIMNAFVKADHAFADEIYLDTSSGTTALIAFVFERLLVVANVGDCRAVLGRRGIAVELSKDHKPNCASERTRIEKLGGVIYDGYLNGQLSVARALGDWHMKGPKGSACPLSAEPELQEIQLAEEDEFLIMGCDGLWDVMSSQYAVTTARKELMLHNDPERCSRELVREALKRNSRDNLTVIIVCFSPDPPPRIDIPQIDDQISISADGLNLLKGVLHSDS